MNKPFAIAAALFALGVAPAAAQQHQHHSGAPAMAAAAPAAAASALPDTCRTAKAAPSMGGHSMAGAGGMNEHQKAAMAGMMQMDADMAQGMMQDDADMAFMCGMIAHHQGAIAMSEVVLKFGKDPQAKALAQRIIDAQKPEIAEMTDWVAKHAGK